MSGRGMVNVARTFSFVDRVETLSTGDEILDALAAELGHFGVEHVIVTGLPSIHRPFGEDVMLRRIPDGWFEHYVEHGYASADPVLKMCRHSRNPFEWRDAPVNPEADPLAAEVMNRARDFGLKEGLSVPIHSLGLDACFSMSGAELDLGGHGKRAAHLMAIFAFERARELAEGGKLIVNPLTPREQEVLCWAGAGKSAADTAEILSISERTVAAHMANVMDKLGAANKTHALARAVKRRFISI